MCIGWPSGAVQAQDGGLEATPEPPAVALPDLEFYRGQIETVTAAESDFGEQQVIGVRILSGDRVDELVETDFYVPENQTEEHVYQAGDQIVISRVDANGLITYGIVDRYRLNALALVVLVFIISTIVFAGRSGLSALVGLAFSFVMLSQVMIPQIAGGANPVTVGIMGAIAIGVVSIYIAHGFNRRTSVAVAATLITIVFAMGLAWLFVNGAALFGTGSEEAYSLQQFSQLSGVDFKGLLLVGIVIGTIGVLDDVTTSLTATIEQLHKANPDFGFRQLVKRGLTVGREHIASLVNTLVFAYAGAAMPVLLFFTIDPRPSWVILNSQFIVEEIVRAMVGSIALMMAVPITAILASQVYSRFK